MKQKLVALAVLAATMFVSVACYSAPADQGMPQPNVQAPPNQPTQGAIPNQSGQATLVPGQPESSGATAPRNALVTPVPGQPGMISLGGIVGTVKSVSGNTVQMTGQHGNAITVQVDDKTTYQKYVTATLADIQTGLSLFVTGETSGGVTKAQSIQIASGGGPAGGPQFRQGGGQPPQGGAPPAPPSGAQSVQINGQPGIGGTVKSVSGNTIQLTSFDGSTMTVQIDSKTVIQKSVSASLSDIKAGARITAFVDSSSSANIARMILIGTIGK